MENAKFYMTKRIMLVILLLALNKVIAQNKHEIIFDSTFKFDALRFDPNLGKDSIRLLNSNLGNYVYLSENNKSTIIKDNDTNKCQRYFEFSTDQDVLSKDNEDRDYTMGVRFQFYSMNSDFKLMKYLRAPFGVKVLRKKFFKANYSAGLSHSAFTPRHIELYNIDKTDRPFAGVLFFNSKATYLRQNKWLGTSINSTIGFEGNFGLIGKWPANISAFMQAGIHAGQAVLQNDTFPLNDPRRSTRPIPRGWPNAILGKNTWPFYNYTITTTKGTEWQNNCTSNIYRLKLNLDAGITSSIGILYDNIGLLGRLEFGWYDQRYFSNESSVVYDMKESKKDRYVDFSFLFNIEKTYWLYNATLQGYPGESDQSPFKLKNPNLKILHFFMNGVLGCAFVNSIVVI